MSSSSSSPTPSFVLFPLSVSALVWNVNNPGWWPNRVQQPQYLFLSSLIPDINSAVPEHISDVHADRYLHGGIYVHFTIPRSLRQGQYHDGPTTTQAMKGQEGLKAGLGNPVNPSTGVQYKALPNRWLITRHVTNAQPATVHFPVYTSWVLESDRLVPTSPTPSEQAELTDPQLLAYYPGDDGSPVNIGVKSNVVNWQGELPSSQYLSQGQLRADRAANPLFLDYQPHSENVFSVYDQLLSNGTADLTSATVSYSVIGWYSNPDTDDPLRTSALSDLTAMFRELDIRLAGGGQAPLPPLTDPALVFHGSVYSVQFQRDTAVTSSWKGLTEPAGGELIFQVAVGDHALDAVQAIVDSTNTDSLPTGLASLLTQNGGLRLLDQLNGEEQIGQLSLKASFNTTSGGRQWRLTPLKADGTADPPSSDADRADLEPMRLPPDAAALLVELNANQRLIDRQTRLLTAAQWDVFAAYWGMNKVVDPQSKWNQAFLDAQLKRVNTLTAQRLKTDATCIEQQLTLTALLQPKPPSPSDVTSTDLLYPCKLQWSTNDTPPTPTSISPPCLVHTVLTALTPVVSAPSSSDALPLSSISIILPLGLSSGDLTSRVGWEPSDVTVKDSTPNPPQWTVTTSESPVSPSSSTAVGSSRLTIRLTPSAPATLTGTNTVTITLAQVPVNSAAGTATVTVEERVGAVLQPRVWSGQMRKWQSCQLLPQAELPFYRTKDPTVLLSGVGDAWPPEYLQTTQVRLLPQVTTQLQLDSTHSLTRDMVSQASKFDFTLTSTAAWLDNGYQGARYRVGDAVMALLTEWLMFDPDPTLVGLYASMSGVTTAVLTAAISSYINPQMPSSESTSSPPSTFPPPPFSLVMWTANPWFPIRFNWQTFFYQTPFTEWRLQPVLDEHGQATEQVQYQWVGNTPPTLQTVTDNDQKVDGYGLILPQANFSMKGRIKQLNSEADVTFLHTYPQPTQVTAMLQDIDQWDCLSYSLNDYFARTASRVPGTHGPVIPAYDRDGSVARAVGSSTSTFTPLCTTSVGPQTDFLGVVHGVLQLQLLQVVDRFGQYIQPPNVQWDWQNTPIISAPRYQQNGFCIEPDSSSNDVFTDRFSLIRPRVAQPARWLFEWSPHQQNNTRLLLTDPSSPRASPAANSALIPQDINPICGWLLVNFLDRAIQFYDAYGAPVGELRLVNNDTALHWDPPFVPVDLDSLDPTLSAFITKLRLVNPDQTPAALKAYMDLLTDAFDRILPGSLSSLATYCSSLLGRPLALCRASLMLELSEPPYKPMNADMQSNQSYTLDLNPDPDTGKQTYPWAVKMGWHSLAQDGVVGYYLDDPSTRQLTTLYTVYGERGDQPEVDILQLELPSTATVPAVLRYPKLAAVFPLNPNDGTVTPKPPPAGPAALPSSLSLSSSSHRSSPVPSIPPARLAHLNRERSMRSGSSSSAAESTGPVQSLSLTFLLDPMASVHLQSDVLPVYEAHVPVWAVAQGLNNLVATFRAGPLLTTVKELDQVDALPLAGVSQGAGEWSWLLPFLPDPSTPPSVAYREVSITQGSVVPQFEPAPYRAVSGYYQYKPTDGGKSSAK